MSKTEATVFVAAGSLLTGFANCMGRGCHESLSNRTGGNFQKEMGKTYGNN